MQTSAQKYRRGKPRFWFCPLRKTSGDVKSKMYKRVAYAPFTRRVLRCARPSPRHACEHTSARQWYWLRSRALVLCAGARAQAADYSRMRSASSHAVYKEDANGNDTRENAFARAAVQRGCLAHGGSRAVFDTRRAIGIGGARGHPSLGMLLKKR